MSIEIFWNSFLEENGLDKSTSYYESFHFELTEKWANELLRLVLIGQKKATASSLWYYQSTGSRLPEVGDYSIVTDWNNNPRCVIMTTSVQIIPFKDITYDICKLEGEDDNLESWRQGHKKFFTNDGQEVGYELTEDMPVVFEEFRVVYQN